MDTQMYIIGDDIHTLLQQRSLEYTNNNVQRAFLAWHHTGYNNNFRDVCDYYYRLEAMEDEMSVEQRAASRAFDYNLLSSAPPNSIFLQEYFPSLYPLNQDYSIRLPTIPQIVNVFDLPEFKDITLYPEIPETDIIQTSKYIRNHCYIRKLTFRQFVKEFKCYAEVYQLFLSYGNVRFYVYHKEMLEREELELNLTSNIALRYAKSPSPTRGFYGQPLTFKNIRNNSKVNTVLKSIYDNFDTRNSKQNDINLNRIKQSHEATNKSLVNALHEISEIRNQMNNDYENGERTLLGTKNKNCNNPATNGFKINSGQSYDVNTCDKISNENYNNNKNTKNKNHYDPARSNIKNYSRQNNDINTHETCNYNSDIKIQNYYSPAIIDMKNNNEHSYDVYASEKINHENYNNNNNTKNKNYYSPAKIDIKNDSKQSYTNTYEKIWHENYSHQNRNFSNGSHGNNSTKNSSNEQRTYKNCSYSSGNQSNKSDGKKRSGSDRSSNSSSSKKTASLKVVGLKGKSWCNTKRLKEVVKKSSSKFTTAKNNSSAESSFATVNTSDSIDLEISIEETNLSQEFELINHTRCSSSVK